jgi:hypothetical protein
MWDGKQEQIVGNACGDFEPLLTLLAADELDSAKAAEVNDHLSHCTSCQEMLVREKELLTLFATNRMDLDAALLAECRANLEDALDQEEERGWLRRTLATFVPSSWVSPRPAWSAALLVLIGFSVGILGPRLLRHPVAPSGINTASSNPIRVAANEPNANDPGNTPLSALDLHTADVAGINVFPSSTNEPPQIELQLRAQQPLTVQGTVNNDDVKRVLIYVMKNNQRFDPDVRLNAVDLLRMRNNDPDIRSALCYAVHTDRNAAVRLKALEALNGAEPQEIIQQTLLDALVDDQNPGVRVEAINALREMAAKGQVESGDHLLAVLRERMQKDPNTYIRLQSAAAIRDLGPRQKF